MGRYYHLSKCVTDAQFEEVKKEMFKIENVKDVEISEDHRLIKVVTKDDEFAGVMGNAVNIFSREAAGTELTFARFAFD